MKTCAVSSIGWDKDALTWEKNTLNWLTKTCQTPAAGSWQAEWSMENHKDAICLHPQKWGKLVFHRITMQVKFVPYLASSGRSGNRRCGMKSSNKLIFTGIMLPCSFISHPLCSLLVSMREEEKHLWHESEMQNHIKAHALCYIGTLDH